MRCFPVIFLSLIACWAPLVSAQTSVPQSPTDDSVTVNVLRDRIAVGEIGQLFIKVRNAEATMPERIETQGLEVMFSGQQSSINIVNGRQSVETTYFYRFRGDDPGTFTIPEFEIRLSQRSGERIAKTRPIVITLLENSDPDAALDATKPFFGKLELTRETFYVNELVPFTLTAYVRGRNSIHDVVTAKLEHESFIFRGFRDVRTDGAEVGNTYYSSAVIPSHLFALKEGSHRLGPAQIVVRSVDSDPGGFGLSSFFQRTATREMATNTLNLNVKPLPNGAPASFTGGVGDFQLSGNPSLTTLGVGDPVSMEFEVTGIGNLRTMGAPVFSIPQTGIWRTYEPNKKLNDEEDSDGFRTGTIRFSQVLIPEVGTDKIPEFQLSFFDPAKESYVTLKAGPFPITMTSNAASLSEPPASYPADGTSDGAPDVAPAKRPEPKYDDVLHIRTGPARWLASAPTGRPGAFFWFCQVVFSIGFCTIAAFGLIRWIAWRRLHESLRTVEDLPFAKHLKQLPRPGSPRRDFFRSINAALAAWKREHVDAPAPVLDAIAKISERCEASLYSGQSQPDAPVSAAEAEEFLSLIRRLPVR